MLPPPRLAFIEGAEVRDNCNQYCRFVYDQQLQLGSKRARRGGVAVTGAYPAPPATPAMAPAVAPSTPTLDGGRCGGFVFGCRNSDEAESLTNLLFGMPAIMKFQIDCMVKDQTVFLFDMDKRVRPGCHFPYSRGLDCDTRAHLFLTTRFCSGRILVGIAFVILRTEVPTPISECSCSLETERRCDCPRVTFQGGLTQVMHGIFKTLTCGQYNIEPSAFASKDAHVSPLPIQVLSLRASRLQAEASAAGLHKIANNRVRRAAACMHRATARDGSLNLAGLINLAANVKSRAGRKRQACILVEVFHAALRSCYDSQRVQCARAVGRKERRRGPALPATAHWLRSSPCVEEAAVAAET